MPRESDWTGRTTPFSFFCRKHWEDFIIFFGTLYIERKLYGKFKSLLTPPVFVFGGHNFA